jgi:uncharacterized RDD family membrane protein YckC
MNEPMQDEDSIFPEADIVFAKFWPRLGAYLLDSIIISVVSLPITYLNVTIWKMAVFFMLTSVVELAYKPFMEYQFGATLGKMAAGIKVVGHNFEKVTLREEIKRVSFYLIPGVLQSIFTLRIYFNNAFSSITNFNEYNQLVVSLNPATVWVVVIVMALFVADVLVFLSNEQNRSLHDMYAGTYVIEKPKY